MGDFRKNCLIANEIGECLLKAFHHMFLKADIMEEFRRLERRRRSMMSDHTCDTITDDEIDANLGITFTEGRNQVRDPMKFTITCEGRSLCRIECMRDEPMCRTIIKYWTVEHAPSNEGYVVLQEDKDSDIKYFKYDVIGVGLPSVCRLIINEIRDALNAELDRQFGPTAEPDEKVVYYDVETKPGLIVEPIYKIDTDYFKTGDIYLLDIKPEFDSHEVYVGDKKEYPRRVYAICENRCKASVIFKFKSIGGKTLETIDVRVSDFEKGLISASMIAYNDMLNQEDNK